MSRRVEVSALRSGNRKELRMSFVKGQDGIGRVAGRKAGEIKLEAWGAGAGSADCKTKGEGEPPAKEFLGSDRLDHSCIFSKGCSAPTPIWRMF